MENKKYIYVNGEKVYVSDEIYKVYKKQKNREEYLRRLDVEFLDFSFAENYSIEDIEDESINVEKIVETKMLIDRLKNAMESLSDAEVRRVIRSSLGTRAKEELIMDFINSTKLSELRNTDDILESFYGFAKNEKYNKIKGLIEEERLKDDSTRFIEKAVSKGYVEYAGDELDSIIPATSRKGGAREKKKESVLEKIRKIVEVFVGI